MFKVAYRVLNDDYLAQDAVQSAFENLIDCLDKIDEINCNKARAFIVIIVRNISIDLYRKRKKQYDIALEDIEDILPDNSKPLDEKIPFPPELDIRIKKAHIPSCYERKIETLVGSTEPEYDELRLFDVQIQVPSRYGDSILSIYLNKDNTQGIALRQGIVATQEFKACTAYIGLSLIKIRIANMQTKSVEGEYKAVNETVKEHFKKNPTPKDELQQPLEMPTLKESTSRPQSP